MKPGRFRRIALWVVYAWEAIAGLAVLALLVWIVGFSFGWWGR